MQRLCLSDTLCDGDYFLRINRDFCPNVIEIEYFCNYERFWILCRSQCGMHRDTAAAFVQYQETPDSAGQV